MVFVRTGQAGMFKDVGESDIIISPGSEGNRKGPVLVVVFEPDNLGPGFLMLVKQNLGALGVFCTFCQLKTEFFGAAKGLK